MPKYKGVVTTEDRFDASTSDHVHIKLVGMDGESPRKTVSTRHFSFPAGSVFKFELNCKRSVGKLILIELDKTPRLLLPQRSWFPAKIELESPEGETYHFPIHRWITNKESQMFREGTEYVQQNWRKDSLFGYQFLNGVNPMVIRRCLVLPENLPIREDLLFLHGGNSLAEEMQYDWLLAKMYVRSADFSDHQLNSHLLRTHLLAEVFSVSLLRNLPMVHPLYKLLVPHTRYTLQINFLARNLLISDSGVFKTV
ncbi:hypothetical protein NHX12_021010 [Muraenolepis orangiensis]|uniref:Uncharacterized protein n=1 Tax=Muraenolepis orangiensis TaxID=630683 RepID=A0A9Q0EPI9_9TELE|nr:hypothetical protein NHX12_021010 [Muraenolepis orangiensis]